MGFISSLFGKKHPKNHLETGAREKTGIDAGAAPSAGTAPDAATPRPAAPSRKKPVANVLMLMDLSASIGQEALDHVSDEGLRCIFETLRRHSLSTETTYATALFGFSERTEEIIPFDDAAVHAQRKNLPHLTTQSVTCMEDALWEAFARIDQLKAKQDAAHTQRAGSVVVTATDGRPTDALGHPTTLSPELVEEIRRRNETRQTSTFVIGMGDVDDATLLQIGPNLQERWVDGQCYEMPRAVRYLGDDYRSKQCWEAVCSLIGQASSSSTGKPFVVDAEKDAAHLPDYADIIMLDSTRFRVVR